MGELIPIERIENRIYLIRGQKVIIDCDLAELYKVTTKRLNEQVKRNMSRFPADFMFQLTAEEFINLRGQLYSANLRSQFATSKHGGRRYFPFVFTEQGIAMLSSVLNSERAIQVNILIMRAFVKLRQLLSTHKDLARKVEELEKKYSKHEIEISAVFKLLKKLMEPKPEAPRKRIGFIVRTKDKGRG